MSFLLPWPIGQSELQDQKALEQRIAAAVARRGPPPGPDEAGRPAINYSPDPGMEPGGSGRASRYFGPDEEMSKDWGGEGEEFRNRHYDEKGNRLRAIGYAGAQPVDAKALFDAAPEAQDAKALFDGAPEVEPSEFGIDYGAAGKDIRDTVGAAGQHALKSLTFGHRTDAALASLLSPSDDPVSYSQARKEMLADDARASQAHPIASAVGEMAPSLLVPGAAFSTLPRALATGAAMGAVQAITDEPDLTKADPRTMARKALLGGAAAAVGFKAPGAAGAAVEPLESAARAQTRRVLSGGGTPLQAGKVPLSDAAADAALERGIVPLGSTQGTAGRLNDAREVLGDQYGRIVAALEAKGITGAERDLVMQEMAAEAVSSSAHSMNPAAPKVYEDAATQLANKPTQRGYLGLTQNEDLKRSAQGMAKSAYQKFEPGEVGEAHEGVASILRKSAEDAISRQMPGAAPDVQAIGAQFKPAKEALGPVIEASRAANQGAAKLSRSRAISLTDTIAGVSGHGWMGLLNHFARTRGASTVAWGSHQLADKVAWLATTDPARLGKYGAVLSNVLQSGGQDALAAHLFVIGQTDPMGSDELRKRAEAE